VVLSVPAITFAPISFSTGMDSPVTVDSSIAVRPSTITPSTGTESPGLTRKRSPACTCSTETSSSVPSLRSRRAIFGARRISARMAPPVRARARSSSTWPSSTRTVITAAASK
jgi:hypothetical protein